MDIIIENAHENNLKHIAASIPLYSLTAITGVSGSGKSTLLRDILAAYGASNYTRIHTKTVKTALEIADYVKVDSVQNLPQTVYLRPVSSISNPFSTVSTVCGILEIIRALFEQFGESVCPNCGKVQSKSIPSDCLFLVDLIYDQNYLRAREMIEASGHIQSENFYNKKMHPIKTPNKSVCFAELHFTLRLPCVSFIKRFNKEFNCTILADYKKPFSPLQFSRCSCGNIVPRFTRSRLSYSTPWDDGGGACSHCGGHGNIIQFEKSQLIADPTKGVLTGGLNFVSEKGIKYTTITENFIQAAADYYKIDLALPVGQMDAVQLDLILYGQNDTITFQDRVGGKKSLLYKGVSGFLAESLRNGKGKQPLSACCTHKACPECTGLRLNQQTDCFQLFGKCPRTLLSMTISELNAWCREVNHDIDPTAVVYLHRLEQKTDYFCRLSCGHLGLDRPSSTLSGGELQRLKICAMINSDITGLCYLLDEPSSGLHPKDIDSLGAMLQEMCGKNTVIIVEHNKRMLQFCDYFVDLGPMGGKQGGQLLFSDTYKNLTSYDTATSKVLCSSDPLTEFLPVKKPSDFIIFPKLFCNNLKNISVKIPKGCFTTVCGISGSGKSTLIRDAIYAQVKQGPEKFGFDQVHYLSQRNTTKSSRSTVCSTLGLTDLIATIFAKASGLKKNFFMLNATDGKCTFCHGKGVYLSENSEPLGICDHCFGQKFSQQVLNIKIWGVNIFELLHTPIDELAALMQNSKLTQVFKTCTLLGVGYLTLSRYCASLSKGEYQRIRLASELASKKTNQLYLLDEPSNGLHASDSRKLLEAIRSITDMGNTVIAVEHNLCVITHSDFIIELGGTGKQGGYLLANDIPSKLKNSPTADALQQQDLIPSKSHPYMEQQLQFSDVAHSLQFPLHEVHRIAQDPEIVMAAARKSEENYLSVIIPDNIFFSKIKNAEISIHAPIFKLIDFRSAIRYDISLYSALGIREQILSELEQHSKERAIDAYIWNERSATGKCPNCNGTGFIETISPSLFISNDHLTPECVKFLNNSTIFKEAKKQLKKKAHVELSATISEMDEASFLALFYGSDYPIEIEKKEMTWSGIINCFLQNHRYYSAPCAEKMYQSKERIPCPVCKGARLRPQYCGSSIWSISYGEFMNLPIDDLKDRLQRDASSSRHKDMVLDSLLRLQQLDLGYLHLGDSLSSLDCVSANLVKLVSLYKNPIFDACILISGLDEIKDTSVPFIRSLYPTWVHTNTLFIL